MIRSLVYSLTLPLMIACSSTEAKNDAIEVNDKKDNIAVTTPDPKDSLVTAYSLALSEYVKAMKKKERPLPDTIYVNKNIEFPDIYFREKIEGIYFPVISDDESTQRFRDSKSGIVVNLVGWLTKERAEFLVFTFFEGGKPQHNCHVNFNRTGNGLQLDTLFFEYSNPNAK